MRDSNEATLYQAILEGELNIAKKLIEQGADVDELHNGESPLHCAVSTKNELAVQLLLEHNANVNVNSARNNDTPLHYVSLWIESEMCDIPKILLERGADCNTRNNSGVTPFLLAASSCSLDTIKLFMEHGADMTVVADEGINVLFYAIRNHHSDVVEFFIDQGFDIEERMSSHLSTPLEFAIRDSLSVDACEVILKRGAQVNTRHPLTDCTPLAFALSTAFRSLKIVQMLLEHRADVIHKVQGSSIFKIAIHIRETDFLHENRSKNETIINLLIQQMAKMECLHVAIYDEDRQLIRNNTGYHEYYNKCMQELGQMEVTKFYNDLSVFSMLVKSNKVIGSYARNEELVTAFEKNCSKKKFPIYFGSIKKRVRAAVLRQKLLTPAAEALGDVFKFNDPWHEVNRTILSYMHDEHLKYLCGKNERALCDQIDI